MKKLEECRQEIDEIDNQLISLFEKRMHVSKEVVEYKLAHNKEIFQLDREQEVLKSSLEKVNDDNLKEYVLTFMQDLMNISKSYQSSFLPLNEQYQMVLPKSDNIIVGYQGVEGSFSYKATKEYFNNVETKNYQSFEDVFIALKKDEIDYGIVPLENSSTGAINDNYDLVRDYGCYIVGEYELLVSQHLLGIKGASLKDLKEVYSHPQGLLQSTDFLNKYPNLIQTGYSNTAASAKYISEMNDKSKGAIASLDAAEFYNLEVIQANIHNEQNNHTRFIIIGKNLEDQPLANCVSIVFTLKHEVGSLYSILKAIKNYHINLSRIESRPIKNENWQYYFYIDFEGNLNDMNVQLALRQMKTHCLMLKVIGNY